MCLCHETIQSAKQTRQQAAGQLCNQNDKHQPRKMVQVCGSSAQNNKTIVSMAHNNTAIRFRRIPVQKHDATYNIYTATWEPINCPQQSSRHVHVGATKGLGLLLWMKKIPPRRFFLRTTRKIGQQNRRDERQNWASYAPNQRRGNVYESPRRALRDKIEHG